MKNQYQEQAEKFLKKYGIKISIKFVDYKPYFVDEKESRNVYRVTLTRKENSRTKKFSFTFGDSIKNTNDGNEPTTYDVLACLEKSDPEDFENFCGNFGYDTDSRKAEKIYKLCVKQWEGLSRFFNSEEIEALQEIQ